MSFAPVVPELELLFRLFIEVGEPTAIDTPHGARKCVPIMGGEFSGTRLSGKILPGGADHVLVRPDGCAEIDARYALETENGATLYVRDQGFRHGPIAVMQALQRGDDVNPTDYYFRTRMQIETGHPEYLWLNNLLLVGSGARGPGRVQVDAYCLV